MRYEKIKLSRIWQGSKRRLAIGSRSGTKIIPSSRGRVFNDLTTMACKMRVRLSPPPFFATLQVDTSAVAYFSIPPPTNYPLLHLFLYPTHAFVHLLVCSLASVCSSLRCRSAVLCLCSAVAPYAASACTIFSVTIATRT